MFIILEIRNLKTKLDEAKGNVEKYEREYDFNKAAEVKYGIIPKLEEQIKEYKKKKKKNENKNEDLKSSHSSSEVKPQTNIFFNRMSNIQISGQNSQSNQSNVSEKK